MTTYTIAYTELLLACAPDGDDTAIEAAIAEHIESCEAIDEEPGDVSIECGLILTDEEPEDEDRIVWRGHDLGSLTDENGKSYDYAIRAA
jgi:hypothetical protein